MSADAHIDYLDFALFADKWLTADPQSDLNSSDPVNMADYLCLILGISNRFSEPRNGVAFIFIQS